MNKETLTKRLDELKKQSEQMVANYNALLGRMAEVELLLKTVDEQERTCAEQAASVIDVQPEGYAE